MATICQPRRALMEIPSPQPKIAARMRRSYMEILSSRMDTSLSANIRSRGLNITSRREQSLDTTLTRPVRPHESPSEKMEDNQVILSKQQLVHLIRSIIMAEQRQQSRAPTSDLKLLQENLHLKKTNVYRSIPYSRLGSNRDAHCYRKALPHLVAFKVACQEGGRALLQREGWDSVLEHSLVAWRYTSELPQWDTGSHNAVREQCFGTLAAHCLTALHHQPPQPSKATELLRRFRMAQVHSQTILPCVQELQRILGQAPDSPSNR